MKFREVLTEGQKVTYALDLSSHLANYPKDIIMDMEDELDIGVEDYDIKLVDNKSKITLEFDKRGSKKLPAIKKWLKSNRYITGK